MAKKYYHNDYKKLIGLDQTRTASEKLLDKAIGGFRPAPQAEEQKPTEKKVKEEPCNLTHSQVLAKLIKNIKSNSVAAKLLKPLKILKKCLEDQSFILSSEVNKEEQWNQLLQILVQVDDRISGSYAEIIATYDCLLEIYTRLLIPFRPSNKQPQVKQEIPITKKQQLGDNDASKGNLLALQKCEMQILFCKLFTDDSFVFNKTLLEFRKRFFSHFEQWLHADGHADNQLVQYLAQVMKNLFNLPYRKYEWIRSSLTQFFKDFNNQYKHLLPPASLEAYLKQYNAFISQKGGSSGGEDVSIFGSGKGGRITSVQVVKDDGFDKWTSKQ